MKKYLQKNLNKQAKELMSMQTLLEQYDHENKTLNRQVLKLLQENTRLKMEKVQNNIINICPAEEKKKAMQMICERRLDKYKYQELAEEERDSPRVCKVKLARMGQERYQATFGKENMNKMQMNMEKLKEEVFFTFGTNSVNNLCGYEKSTPEENEQIGHSQQKSHTQLSEKTQTLTDLSESCTNIHRPAQNMDPDRSQAKKRDFTSQKKLRTVHSIRPSPQITPIRKDKNQNTTPSKNPKQPAFQYRQKKRQAQSTEKRKRYIQVLSIFKTPSKAAPNH